MKEDLAIARGALYRSQEENKRLLAQLERSAFSTRVDLSDFISPGESTSSKVSQNFIGKYNKWQYEFFPNKFFPNEVFPNTIS